MALALVLSYHQVDGLLGIVEVKLVVLLLVDALSIVVEIFAIQICWDFGTILTRGACPGSTKDFLLELHLLLCSCFNVFERLELTFLAVLGGRRLVRHVVQQEERRVFLSLLIEPSIQKAHLFIIFLFELTFDTLILDKLKLLLLLFRGEIAPNMSLWLLSEACVP